MKSLKERWLQESKQLIQSDPKEVSAKKSFEIFKTDDDQHLVFGWASVAITVTGEELEDRQHDMIDPEELEEAAYEYVLNFRDTGEEHLPGYRKKGKLVESCVFTPEKQRAMGIPEGIVPVAWWIGFKIDDEDTWRRVKDGTYKMFSIEGKAQREPVQKAERTALTFDDVLKFNPNHDSNGRFSSSNGAGGGGSTPSQYSKITQSEAQALAKEMGQDPSQMDPKDIDQVLNRSYGYFGTPNSFDINEILREGWDPYKTPDSDAFPDDDLNTIKTLDRNMKPSTRDIQVYRMIGKSFYESVGIDPEHPQDAVGKVYDNDGYTSASFDLGENVFKSRPVKLNINVPKGTPMLVSPDRDDGRWEPSEKGNVSEAEILLGRKTAMVITAVRPKYNRFGDENGIEVDLEVLLD